MSADRLVEVVWVRDCPVRSHLRLNMCVDSKCSLSQALRFADEYQWMYPGWRVAAIHGVPICPE